MDTASIWKNVGGIRPPGYLLGAGRMADAILAFDWSKTSLGAIETWPASIRSVVRMAVHTRQPICLFLGPDLSIVYNDAYAPFLGAREIGALGQPFEIVWSDVWDDVAPIVREALSGKGTWSENLPLTMTRNGFDEQTYWSFSYSPLHDDDDRIVGLINIATETTQALKAKQVADVEYADARQIIAEKAVTEERQRGLQNEMAHRIKNTLSMVMAIVSQTMRHAESMEAATVTIGERINALSQAQDLLRQTTYASAMIADVVKGALKVHLEREDRVTVLGPQLELPSQAALGLSLAIHELATNAVKYGALSDDAGHVDISWRHADDGAFTFEWRERGGPAVERPTRKGFGSRLIDRIVPSYFEGTGTTEFAQGGLCYRLNGIVSTTKDDSPEPTDTGTVAAHEHRHER